MALDEGIGDVDVGELYTEFKLATLTGWSLEYINNLSVLQSEAFLQIYEAEQALYADGLKGKRSRRRR